MFTFVTYIYVYMYSTTDNNNSAALKFSKLRKNTESRLGTAFLTHRFFGKFCSNPRHMTRFELSRL